MTTESEEKEIRTKKVIELKKYLMELISHAATYALEIHSTDSDKSELIFLDELSIRKFSIIAHIKDAEYTNYDTLAVNFINDAARIFKRSHENRETFAQLKTKLETELDILFNS